MSAGQRYRDRYEAGRSLANKLADYVNLPDLVVLGLPRGGVPVAFEVARALGAPLDVFIVRKLGVPGPEELAMGAIASGGIRGLNDDVLPHIPVPRDAIEAVSVRDWLERERRERSSRGSKPPLDVNGKTVVIVDDGLATGSSMRAAVRALRKENAGKVIVAVPVAARETCESFSREIDDVICLRTPSPFEAVGLWYDDFSQTTGEEVPEMLARQSE